MSDPYTEGLGAYITAVEANPRRPGEEMSKYITRIAEEVNPRVGAPKDMPREPGQEG